MGSEAQVERYLRAETDRVAQPADVEAAIRALLPDQTKGPSMRTTSS
jgi:hypothetical protein